MLNRLSINLKVFIAPIAVMLLLLGVSIGAVVALRSQGAASKEVVGSAFDAATTTSRLGLTVAGVHSDVLRYVDFSRLDQDPIGLKTLRERIEHRIKLAEAMLLSLEANAYSVDRDLLHDVGEFLAIYRTVSTRVMQTEPVNPTLVSTLMANYQQLDAYIDQLATATIKSAKEKQQQTEIFVDRAVRVLLIGAIVSLLAAMVVSWLIGRAISVPLTEVTAVMSRLAGGDHNITIPAMNRKDEVGSIARAVEVFRQASLQLRHREQELAQMVDRLALMRDRAAEASRAKSSFLANMSHELRTPLNAVIGYSEMLVDGIYGELPEKAHNSMERVRANAKHLLGLLNEVLDLSKIEAGQFKLNIVDYQLDGVISQVATTMESLSQAKKLNLSIDVPQRLPRARGDEQRITQVLLNLVSNAIKFTDSGSVTIRGVRENGTLKVEVEDTGPGVPKEDQERIFEEFVQVDNSTTRKKGGTGLGLAIAKRIIELHGGRIGVVSTPGHGAIFWFALPKDVEPTEASA